MNDSYEAELAALFGHKWADYLIICSAKYQYVYVGIPKAASSTVRRILTWLEVGEDLSRVPADIFDWPRMPIPNMSRSGVTIQEAFFGERYFRFALVRNPYTRILSCYLNKIAGPFNERKCRLPKLGLEADAPVSFNTFLAGVKQNPVCDDHWAPQKHLLNPDRINYDLMGRFEEFENTIICIVRKIQPGAVVPLQNLANNRHATGALTKVEEYIGVEEAKLIEEIYDDDFSAFGYSRDPRLVTS